jgi:hypothetical protein
MKTVLLFSSVFYLLGLKIGNTIEILKKVAVPVKTIIALPAAREEKPEKTYYFKTGDAVPGKEKESKGTSTLQKKETSDPTGKKTAM